jgi:hypothetical protein
MGDLLGWEGLIVFGISGSAWKEIQRRAGRALSKADRRAWHDRITKQGLGMRLFPKRDSACSANEADHVFSR